jgi:putative tryptophan/tyrosine transport system substrate-binding protein
VGGLLAYATDYHELFRRAAAYVDRIVKGAKPGELPIQQATNFQLTVNAQTARELGLAVPEPLLLQAARVIDGRSSRRSAARWRGPPPPGRSRPAARASSA